MSTRRRVKKCLGQDHHHQQHQAATTPRSKHTSDSQSGNHACPVPDRSHRFPPALPASAGPAAQTPPGCAPAAAPGAAQPRTPSWQHQKHSRQHCRRRRHRLQPSQTALSWQFQGRQRGAVRAGQTHHCGHWRLPGRPAAATRPASSHTPVNVQRGTAGWARQSNVHH